VLWTLQGVSDTCQEQFVGQLWVGIRVKGVARTQADFDGQAVLRDFHPKEAILVDGGRAGFVETLEETAPVAPTANFSVFVFDDQGIERVAVVLPLF
jgi:hypothetical protein